MVFIKPKLKGRNFIWDLHAVVGTWVIIFICYLHVQVYIGLMTGGELACLKSWELSSHSAINNRMNLEIEK